MGTSASHQGPKSGVSFDPPWLNDIDSPEVPVLPMQNPQTPTAVPLIAPPARFKSARIDMGNYIRSGNRESLTRSLGHYSRTGMGGAHNVARRMGHSASIASKLYTSFSSLSQGNEPTIKKIINDYWSTKTDVYGLIDAIAEYICTNGGSLDETSACDSVSSALSDLFDKCPDIEITALSDDIVWSLVSSFLGYEAFSRIQLDIGRGFETTDISLADRVTRLNDMREYLESEISSQINVIRNEIGNKQPSDLQKAMMTAIERTFKVFEVTV
jgi:hypothetical protein